MPSLLQLIFIDIFYHRQRAMYPLLNLSTSVPCCSICYSSCYSSGGGGGGGSGEGGGDGSGGGSGGGGGGNGGGGGGSDSWLWVLIGGGWNCYEIMSNSRLSY
jgi:uncharacterized membrane protein YgcG